MAFPLALLIGGDARTFALWHDSTDVDSGLIKAGNLDADDGHWSSWRQVDADGDTVPDQSGTCLEPEDQGKCAGGSKPLSAFVAWPGDTIQLVGQVTTELKGDNIAAELTVAWVNFDNNDPSVEGTYTVSAKDATDSAATFAPVMHVDQGTGAQTPIKAALGDPVTIVTITDSTHRTEGGSNAAILPHDVLDKPYGIHEAGKVAWQVTVTLTFEDDLWVDPGDLEPAEPFTVPALELTLEQIRVGEDWGVNAP
jgi:alternate signal-mediated exported protein